MSIISTATTSNQSVVSPTSCQCHEHKSSQQCCCGLICYERPRYFCGHMLTDADLSLEQKYVIEKNKLYHRAIDGYGVVCGLKLTCDCDCKGHILIHEGFAIDDCGNDLVVCETIRFDVITALKNKNLHVFEPPADECEPRHRQPRCENKQCYYVTICYEEQVCDYETPFQSSCTAGPKECLPTRTKERVRIDLTDTLPPQNSYIQELEKKLKCCFEIYSEGQIGLYLKRHIQQILAIVEGKWRYTEEWCDPCEIFCTLRALFLHQLKLKPDQFRCNLIEEVACLRCPEECRENDERYSGELQQAFSKLLTHLEQYQFDCVFGELVFACQEPCEAHCVVLGTVEVLDGKLIRVCNTPRKYVWSSANFVPVLIETLLTGALGMNPGETCKEGGKSRCCPDYRHFDPCAFLKEFEVNESGRLCAATALPRALDGFVEALQSGFDFTDSQAVSAEIFKNKSRDKFHRAVDSLGINSTISDTHPAALRILDPIQAVLARALFRPGDSVVAYMDKEGEVGRVLPNFGAELSPQAAHVGMVESNVEQRLEELSKKVTAQQREITNLKSELKVFKQKPSQPNESGTT